MMVYWEGYGEDGDQMERAGGNDENTIKNCLFGSKLPWLVVHSAQSTQASTGVQSGGWNWGNWEWGHNQMPRKCPPGELLTI